jgi:hypothetical protein
MNAGEKHQGSSKEEEEGDSLQAMQSNGSASETSDNENSTDESRPRERGDRSDKIHATVSIFKDNCCRGPVQPLGGEGKISSTHCKQRSRSQDGNFPVLDNSTELGNESENHETPTTFPYSASSMSSPSFDKIRLQAEGSQTNRLPLLSNLAQARAPAQTQRQAPRLDESLLNQQASYVAASAQAQLTAMAGFTLARAPQLIPPLSPQSSLLGQLQLALIAQNRTGFPLDSQMAIAASKVPFEVLSLTPSLMGQLQLALIAQNRTSFGTVPQQQIPAPQAPSPPYQTSPLLVQMQLASMAQNLLSFPLGCTIAPRQQIPTLEATSPPLQPSTLLLQMQRALMAQNLTDFPIVPNVLMTAGSPQQPPFLTSFHANQSSYLPPAQSASALSREFFFYQPSASQNPSFVLKAQNQSQELRIVQESDMIKDQNPALLLSQQRAGGTNTTIPGMIQSSANQTELLLRALAANASSESKLRNSIQGTLKMATTAAVSAFHHSLPSPTSSNNYNMGLYSSEAASSELALRGHVHDSSRTQEKRWLIRYEELIQFRQVRNLCNTRQSFPLSRSSMVISVVLLCFSLLCLISR